MSAERVFSAADVSWMDRGRCAEAPSGVDFTPRTETKQELAFVRAQFCDQCPVRTKCLAYALLYRESGYWGGTDTAERRMLSRSRTRVKCPVCRCKSVLRTDDGYELCQSCAVSWAGDNRPAGRDQTT